MADKTPIILSSSLDSSGDKRLDRLFDYTKFHIGIYLSAGGGLLTVVGFAAENGSFVNRIIGSPRALLLSLVAMLVAGIAGGVIASGATQCHSFEDLWDRRQGPHTWKWFSGRAWASIEHSAFWASLALFAYSILCAPAVRCWLLSCPDPDADSKHAPRTSPLASSALHQTGPSLCSGPAGEP